MNIQTRAALRRALLVTSALAGMAGPGAALAQTAAAEAEEGGAVEEIVVTGTLVQNPNLESSSPISFVSSNEVALRQSVSVESVIRDIPGVVPNLGQNVNNGQIGVARVDLRGLGSNRNIVLLDSNRIVPANFAGSVDLNIIPLALIDRVDVLTGGASTSYGADAVTGVVNFITRRNFQGLDLSVSEQLSEKGDTNNFRADLTIGANVADGRGNVVLSVGYQEADPLYFGGRPLGFNVVNSLSGFAGGDSPTSVPTTIGFATGNLQVSRDNNSLVPAYAPFNFNPFNIYVTPFERFNIFAKARYEVSDKVEVYTRGLFSKTTVASIVAPSGVFGEALTVPGNNPFLSASLRDALCTANGLPTGAACAANPAIPLPAVYRRTVELGPRLDTYTSNVFDYQAGVIVNLTDSIKADIYGAYGETENRQVRSGYVARSRLQQALNANNPNTCTNTANGCVPLNLFGQAGSITEAQAGFIGGITSSIVNSASLAQVHGVVSGDVGFSSPWASEPVNFAVGGEYRKYKAQREPDNLAQVPGELGGAGGAIRPLSGGFDVYEAFGELIVPIASGKSFAEELTLEAGIRRSSYRVDAPNDPKFKATTYKVGLTWAPVEAIKFRSNYQKAVRAPNIGELFAPVTTGLTNLAVDPCAGAALARTPGQIAGTEALNGLQQACVNQGSPAASLGIILNPAAGQANATAGGNPALSPETAKTLTAGVVLRPEGFIPGLTITVDYYRIKVTDAITAATPNDVIFACFGNAPYNITVAQANSAACTSIRRSAANGRLSGSPATIPGLPTPFTNSGILKTSGIDFSVNYKRDIGFADLTWNLNGNITDKAQFQASPSSINRECVGYYSANCGLAIGQIQPKFSFNQRTTLSFDDIDVSLLWRHIDSVKYEPGLPALFSGTITGTGPLVGRQVNFNRIKAYDYFDLTTRFAITSNLELTLSVFNLLDKQPPILGGQAGTTSANSGNTFPSTYDVVGRRYAATARLKF
jgi:iron complex outermembrane recepter protein